MKWQNIAYCKITIKISAIIVLLFLLSSNVYALGIGGIKLSSTLDQPLDANIELLGVSQEELSEIEIKLASNAIYERMGIERTTLVEQLVFTVQEQDDGKHVIHISTPRPVTEPFLNFLIEVNWRNGRLLREFTVLLDPPVLLEEEAAPVAAPEAELPSTFSVTTESGQSDVLEPMVEVQEPVEAEVAETAESEEVVESTADSAPPTVGAGDITNVAAASTVHTVQRNEYLWKIANDMRPSHVSVEQMMLALQRANPEAFFGETVSQLKAGAVLRVDDPTTLTSISQVEAVVEIARQHQEWLAYKRERQARNAVAADSADTLSGESEGAGSSTVDDVAGLGSEESSLLKLVSPINEGDSSDSGQTNATMEAGESELENLNIELAMAAEEVEAKRRENEDLQGRLTSLQDQLSKAKNLIELKDKELGQFDTGVENEAISEVMPSVEINTADSGQTEHVAPIKQEGDQQETQPSKNIWEDPATLGTAAGVALLLLLVTLVVRRKRKERLAEQESEVTDYEDSSLEELFADSHPSKDETQVIKFNDSYSEKEDSDISLEPLTELSFDKNENELLENKEPLLDPIAEADVYLTYEKYDKAIELLNDAIQLEPSRQELKLKLLEVYALSRNLDGFNNAADILYASISGDDQHPIWIKAERLAKEIGSESPLFSNNEVDVEAFEDSSLLSSETGSAEKILEEDAPLLTQDQSLFSDKEIEEPGQDKKPFSASTSKFEELTDEDLIEHFSASSEQSDVNAQSLKELDELNLGGHNNDHDVLEFADLDDIQSEKVVESKPLETTAQDVSETDVLSFDDLEMELDDGVESSTATVGKPDKNIVDAQQSASAAVEELVDKLEFPGDDERTISVDDVFENTSKVPTKFIDDDDNDTSLFLLSDEVGTKLDLAKAYMEMGDHEGAKDLLSEVLGEGNSKQKAEAKELLETTTA